MQGKTKQKLSKTYQQQYLLQAYCLYFYIFQKQESTGHVSASQNGHLVFGLIEINISKLRQDEKLDWFSLRYNENQLFMVIGNVTEIGEAFYCIHRPLNYCTHNAVKAK